MTGYSQDGFEGVQLMATKPPLARPLAHCTLDRINTPQEADGVVARQAGLSHTCQTVHAGWELEDDDAMDQLVEAILVASE